MAKVYFGKLDLNRDNSVKTFNWNSQVIEVKQYLPVEEKLDLITKILTETDDGGKFFNPSRLKVFYTNHTKKYSYHIAKKQLFHHLAIHKIYVIPSQPNF